jgi:hypothetical protein
MPCASGYQTLLLGQKQAGQHIIYTKHVLAASPACERIGVAMAFVGEGGNRKMSLLKKV